MFESRIRFVMIGDLAATLDELEGKVSLIVVDEAHHAAAPSYAPIFASHAPALFLTATPVRADKLPIGIDRVAYTITYRELFERNCVIEPVFDPPLDMSGLDWSDARRPHRTRRLPPRPNRTGLQQGAGGRVACRNAPSVSTRPSSTCSTSGPATRSPPTTWPTCTAGPTATASPTPPTPSMRAPASRPASSSQHRAWSARATTTRPSTQPSSPTRPRASPI